MLTSGLKPLLCTARWQSHNYHWEIPLPCHPVARLDDPLSFRGLLVFLAWLFWGEDVRDGEDSLSPARIPPRITVCYGLPLWRYYDNLCRALFCKRVGDSLGREFPAFEDGTGYTVTDLQSGPCMPSNRCEMELWRRMVKSRSQKWLNAFLESSKNKLLTLTQRRLKMIHA